jgi:hypothetical protein
MKRLIGLAALVLALVFTAGCPYTSKVPLGQPDRNNFDLRLLGLWEGYDHAEDVGPVLVLSFNDAEYYVETQNEENEPDRYRAYIVKVDGQNFLQLNEIGHEGAALEYIFARYTFDNDSTLSVTFVGDRIVPKDLATDSESLVTFFAAHLNDTSFDDRDVNLLMRRK